MRRNSKSERERELANQARLTRAWKKFHREEREAVLAGPYARTLAELFRMFANLKHAPTGAQPGSSNCNPDT